jgi:two-component system, LuxR family, response regulator FixJ
MPAASAAIDEATPDPASGEGATLRRASPAAETAPMVYVVDDDPLVCAMLMTLIGSMNLACVSFDSASEFLAAFDASRPSCLLCDVKMPGMTGLDLQRELNLRGATLPVIFVTAYADVPTAVAAMRDGAFDFLMKPFNHADLFEKLRAALVSDQVERKQVSGSALVKDRLNSLTPREREVLSLLVEGLPNKEMATRLALSLRTIELHRARLMSKMSAKSLAELVRTVTELGPTAAR